MKNHLKGKKWREVAKVTINGKRRRIRDSSPLHFRCYQQLNIARPTWSKLTPVPPSAAQQRLVTSDCCCCCCFCCRCKHKVPYQWSSVEGNASSNLFFRSRCISQPPWYHQYGGRLEQYETVCTTYGRMARRLAMSNGGKRKGRTSRQARIWLCRTEGVALWITLYSYYSPNLISYLLFQASANGARDPIQDAHLPVYATPYATGSFDILISSAS